jgi:hypothetical protein
MEFLSPRAREGQCLPGVGCGVLRTGGAAPQSTICKKRVAASSRIELADPRRRGGIPPLFVQIDPWLLRAHRMPFSGERTTCEPSFAHPTMQSPQKSLAPDEPKYLLSRAR